MATTNTTSVLSLPFVADIPSTGRSKKTKRSFWVIPDDADYHEAFHTGSQWAEAFIRFESASGSSLLPFIVSHIAESEARLPEGSGAKGFSAGFMSKIADLAMVGAQYLGAAARKEVAHT